MTSWYFAYGSNLLPGRLEARVGTLDVPLHACLLGHRLAFHKAGSDDSGKCDAHFTGDHEDRLHGVVYRLTEAMWPVLDRFEGPGYSRERVWVRLGRGMGGRSLEAQTYVARDIREGLLPYDWYHALVLSGARWHGLPAEHLDAIAAVACRPDPEPERAARVTALLQG